MAKPRIIDIEAHSFFRMLERGMKFGLSLAETKERCFLTVREGKAAKRKHLSREGRTYHRYFGDNLSFYVLCRERELPDYRKIIIKTVIIERGRE